MSQARSKCSVCVSGGENEKRKKYSSFFSLTSPPSVGELKCLMDQHANAVCCVALGVLGKKQSIPAQVDIWESMQDSDPGSRAVPG